MALLVRFKGGGRAGEVLSFDDSKEFIRFGRDEHACDVTFPTEELKVSREHFLIHRILGGYRITTNRQNPVYVNGIEAHDDMRLEGVCEIQVGRNGPKVLLEYVSESDAAATEGQKERSPGAFTRAREAAQGLVTARRWIRSIVVAIALLGAGVVAGYGVAAARMTGQDTRIANAMHSIADVQDDVSKRLGSFKASFRPVFERLESTVWLVCVTQKMHTVVGDTSFTRPIATACVIGPGRFATNAHVAEEFESLKPGDEFFLLSTANPPERVRIERASIHPGYAEFSERLAHAQVFDPSVGASLSLPPACDVALLFAAKEDASKLGPPIPIASQAELEKLDRGDPLAFIGFPMEGIVHAGTELARPRATFQIGTVTNVTDFFLGRSDSLHTQLIHFNMPAAGGASGSPVINQDGKLVALLNSGNSLRLEGYPRIPVGGINYGQRADLLVDLIEGRSKEASESLAKSWGQEFDRLVGKGAEGVFAMLGVSFVRALNERGVSASNLKEIFRKQSRIQGKGEAGGTRFEFTIPEDGWYLVAAAPNRSVDLDAALVYGGQRTDDNNSIPYARFQLRAGKGQQLTVIAYSDEGAAEPPTEVDLRVFQAEE